MKDKDMHEKPNAVHITSLVSVFEELSKMYLVKIKSTKTSKDVDVVIDLYNRAHMAYTSRDLEQMKEILSIMRLL